MDPQISISAIRRTDSAIEIPGAAHLPDGARLRCGLWRGGPEGPFEGIMYVDTDVQANAFTCRFRPPTPWHGLVSGSVELRADPSQPHHVQDVIGPGGEELAYADTRGSGYAQIFTVASADLGPRHVSSDSSTAR